MTKKIIIVGGGFAGLELAKKLANNDGFHVTVVDRNNYHFFPPLLYQVSTAFIEPSNISYPYRRMFQDKENIWYFMGNLLRVVPGENTIETDNGNLHYDYLVLAMGTETNFFGNENIKRNALPMKTIDDALNIRNQVLLRLEEAARCKFLTRKEKLANIVIAGGGPTGVEMAGMLGEMARSIKSKDYPEIFGEPGTIYLVNGGPTLLGTMSKKAQVEAENVLKKLGIKIIQNTLVKDYVADDVVLSNGDIIPAATLIWTSGVIAREVAGLPYASIAGGRRIVVDEINRVKGYTNIFAIGDQALQTTDKAFPNGHPQLAQVAIQQGKWLGGNLKRIEKCQPTKAFKYSNRGSAAIISKYRAVVDLPKGSFKGYPAWLVWLFIHIMPLIGFRNKMKIGFNWLSSFLTMDPTLRLIIRPMEKRSATPVIETT